MTVSRTGSQWGDVLPGVGTLSAVVVPALVLGAAALAAAEPGRSQLAVGAAVQLGLAVVLLWQYRSWREGFGLVACVPYAVALAWLVPLSPQVPAGLAHLGKGLLVLVPVGLLTAYGLRQSGVIAMHRVRELTQRLADRTDWPADPAECRNLPEVRALRETPCPDATPLLTLLRHPVREIRLAALAVLEDRREWRGRDVEQVLKVLRSSDEPAVRIAALSALAPIVDQGLVETLGEFLRDPTVEVRQAAARVLLADSTPRWTWLRPLVRQALADAALQGDGPLPMPSQGVGPEVLADLTAWSGEKGVLGVRAALTLGAYFQQVLAERPEPGIVANLRGRLVDPQTSAALRVELAQLLRSSGDLQASDAAVLLDPAHPAPLRLLAADLLLAEGKHPQALAVLREIARLPNREMALSTAEVVQRRLGVDLGLPRGQPLPPLHSRPAAEVTRRVMMWANQPESSVSSG